MAQAIDQSTTVSGLSAANIVRFPTAAAPQRFQDLPAVDLRTLAESETHVMFAVSISREVLQAHIPLLARLMNVATGL
jgi:hypothetical protein